MKILRLLKGDLYFQYRYGFYYIYLIFIIIYLLMLGFIPGKFVNIVACILIFTDPAAMGFFFMGAVVLLEKSQKVNFSIVTSPVKMFDYIISKIISFAIIGSIIALIIVEFVNMQHVVIVLLSVIMSSLLFSLCGLLIALKIKNLNQFILVTVPVELIILIPVILMVLYGENLPFFVVHPGIATLQLLLGNGNIILNIMSIVSWFLILLILCNKVAKKFYIES